MFELVLFVVLFVLGLGYFSTRKRKVEQMKSEAFSLQIISEQQLNAWLPLSSFQFMHSYENGKLSELMSGEYKGAMFIMFLFSCSGADGQCNRQTVTVAKLKHGGAPFVLHEKDLWVESDGQWLVVFKEKQSMTCGSPINLFLERIERWKERVYRG